MALAKNTIAINRSLVTDDVTFSWGKVFLAVFAFMVIGRIQEVIPVLASPHITLVAGALAGSVWLFSPGSFQDKIPMRIPQVKHVIWLFLLSLALVPISVWPGNSVDFIFGTYVKVILFFLMVIFWTRTVGNAQSIIWACCLGVCALVLLGVILGFGDVERFEAGSVTYDANDLAFVLVLALPLIVYLFSVSKFVSKTLTGGMIFICLYGILLTGSRGGFLALAAVSGLILFRSKIGIATKLGMVAVALVVFVSLAGSQYWDRMSTIWSPQNEYDETAGGRTTLWKDGLKLLATHPWGVGIHNYEIAEGLSHGGEGKWSTAHNSFIQLGVELGVLGGVVFIVLVASTLNDLRRIQVIPEKAFRRKSFAGQPFPETKRGQEPLRDGILPLARALETSMWGFVVGGFFLSQAFSPMLYCVLALSLACKRMQEPQKGSMNVSEKIERTSKYQVGSRTVGVNRS